jgi:hypothetical protein
MLIIKNYHVAKYFWGIFAVSTVLFSVSPKALAQQFNVTAISPAHGETNVSLAADLSITFSAALDTGFRFTNLDLPVNLELHPDTAFAALTSYSFSADLRTIHFHDLNLQPNTRYALLVTGGRSVSRTPLSRPETAVFSTGAVLPSGSVGGTISYTGGASGAVVGVFSSLDEGATVSFAIAESNGDYTAPFLPGGNYFALSIKDMNLDGEINPGKVDPIGGFDPDANKLVNQFTLPGGTSLGGINITLRNSTPKTARELYSPTIENLAKSIQSDAQLVALAAGNLAIDGKSTFWSYLFYSATTQKNFGISGTDVICFPSLDFDSASDTLDLSLPPNWIDSKVALDTAQARVGKEFLQKYPDAEISGFAGTIEPDANEGSATPSAFRVTRRPFYFAKQVRPSLYATRHQPQQAWVITYNDAVSGRLTFIVLDAQTGQTLFIFRLTTALANLSTAQQAALLWAADAQLVLVAAPPGGFSPVDGASPAWVFRYYSAAKDSLRQFFIFFGNLTGQNNVIGGPIQPIPPGWLDSDKTAPVAESLGGANFRQTHSDAQTEAWLGYVNPANPNRLFWNFRYHASAPPPDSLIIYVDALTGVNVRDESITPREFTLLPAYPNPFQYGQIVQWSLQASNTAIPSGVEVRANIYNMLGQQVAKILQGTLPAGASVLNWDGRLTNGLPAASGVYFLRFEYRAANGEWQVMTQPLLLQK